MNQASSKGSLPSKWNPLKRENELKIHKRLRVRVQALQQFAERKLKYPGSEFQSIVEITYSGPGKQWKIDFRQKFSYGSLKFYPIAVKGSKQTRLETENLEEVSTSRKEKF